MQIDLDVLPFVQVALQSGMANEARDSSVAIFDVGAVIIFNM